MLSEGRLAPRLDTGDVLPGSALPGTKQLTVAQTQRSRILSSAIAVVSEHGYGEMSVARVTGGAGVSRRTFYDLFEDREDCFLAAFEDALSRARGLMLGGSAVQRGWNDQVRGALFSLLVFLDREPEMGTLLVVEALKAGPRVQQRRVEVLGELSRALDATGSRTRSGRELPTLTSEGVIGAILSVIHTRLMATGSEAIVELINPLMSMIALPYLGRAAAQRELARPRPRIAPVPPRRQAHQTQQRDPLMELPMRITYRTLLVLAVIDGRPGASNRQVADASGVSDQGQISKLLARLEGLGLIENSSPGQPSGEPNAWHLTPRGQEVKQATRTDSSYEGRAA